MSMSITTEYMVERAPYIGCVWRLRAHIVHGMVVCVVMTDSHKRGPRPTGFTWNFVKQLNFSLYSLDTNCAFLVFVMLDHQKHTCFILFIFTRVANRIYDFSENITCYSRLDKDHLQHFRLYFRQNLKFLSTWRVFNVAYKLF